MFARRIGIDLGTANVLVYVVGKGVVLNEPSVVSLSTKSGRVLQVGREAMEMIGRNPDTIEVIRPMRNGVIADYVVTEAMLNYFIRRVSGWLRPFKPEVMISIPAGATTVEMRAVRDAALQAGARTIHLIREPLAASIGANVPIAEPTGNMIVGIGGGTTEVAVISLNGIVVCNSIRVAGNRLDEAISAYIKRKYNLLVGERTAEEIKIRIGSALIMENPLKLSVRGRDQISGLPRTVEISSTEITEAMTEPLQHILEAVRSVLVETPPELASDIIDRGIVLTGGTSQLRHLDRLLTQASGVPCYVADNPLMCTAIGTGLALQHIAVLRDSLSDAEVGL
ncbi:MAG: rod shape-determining protein [Chloroflexia bacterium]|nr:rod shape-determining protein [Chloroflexia bacterium]